MNENDKKRFSEIMYGLAEDIGVDIGKPGLKLKFEALKNFNIEEIEKSVLEIMKTWKERRIPPVSVFLEFLGQKQIPSQIKAEIEANKIICHLRYHGARVMPVIEDPITKHLMNRRWPYLQWAKEVIESELVWWIKEFKLAYQAYQESGNSPTVKEIEAPESLKKLIRNIGNE